MKGGDLMGGRIRKMLCMGIMGVMGIMMLASVGQCQEKKRGLGKCAWWAGLVGAWSTSL